MMTSTPRYEDFGINPKVTRKGKPRVYELLPDCVLPPVVYFYFVSSLAYVKIGTTRKFAQRYFELRRVFGPIDFMGCMLGTFRDEAQIKKQFAHLSQGLEIYSCEWELREFIMDNCPYRDIDSFLNQRTLWIEEQKAQMNHDLT